MPGLLCISFDFHMPKKVYLNAYLSKYFSDARNSSSISYVYEQYCWSIFTKLSAFHGLQCFIQVDVRVQ